MKKFFQDFKKFITRGNIIDMAVGVIVGGAFSAIVKALTDQIIMPLINSLLALIGGKEGLAGAVTILRPAYDSTGAIDLANSIYINWGAFITAVINFFIIALTLFIVLKVAMKSSQMFREATDKAMKARLTKEDKAELKARGVSRKDKEAVKAYFAEKEAKLAEEKAAAEEQARLAEEEAKKNSTEYLLKEIRDLLKENQELKEQAKKK